MKQEVMTGKVVWFNDKRGYGFVKPDDGTTDLFVHFSNILADQGKFKTLTAGQKVGFTIGANKNGPQAENVTLMDEDE
jgi:CspA family cold shock protein